MNSVELKIVFVIPTDYHGNIDSQLDSQQKSAAYCTL